MHYVYLKCSFIFIFLAFRTSKASTIHFYKNPGFTGLLFSSSSITKCNNFSNTAQHWIRSIKTDSCFMVYEDANCNSIYNRKVIKDVSFEKFLSIRSFHICNEEQGGPHLNLDLTTFQNDNIVEPTVLASYKDVCTCINIPPTVKHLDKWSIENHGNELFAYFEPNCQSTKFSPSYIRAGRSWISRNIYDHKKINLGTNTSYINHSVGPHPNSTYFLSRCNFKVGIKNQKQISILEEKTSKSEVWFSSLPANISDIRTKHNTDIQAVTSQIVELKESSSQFRTSIHSEVVQLALIVSQGQKNIENYQKIVDAKFGNIEETLNRTSVQLDNCQFTNAELQNKLNSETVAFNNKLAEFEQKYNESIKTLENYGKMLQLEFQQQFNESESNLNEHRNYVNDQFEKIKHEIQDLTE